MTKRLIRFGGYAVRLAAVAVVLGYLLAAAAPSSAAPALGRVDLDLPALALRPADLDSIGLEDYRASNGSWFGVDDTVFQVAFDYKLDTDEVSPVLVAEGVLRSSYAVLISNVFLNDEGMAKSTRGVWVTLYEFGSTEGAAAGYGFFADRPFGSLTDEPSPLAMPTIGDDSFAAQWDDADMNSGDPMTYFGLGFRTGRVYVELLFWDIVRPGEQADPPTTDELTGIAHKTERRVERGLAGDAENGTGLSRRVARFQADDLVVAVIGDRYTGIDGTPVHAFDESLDELDERADQMETDGMIASYRVQQEIVSGHDFAASDPQLMIQAERYADAASSSAGLQATFEDYQGCGCFEELVPADDLPALGDEIVAMAVTLPFSAEGNPGYFLLIRTGEIVSQVWLTSLAGETLEHALAVAEVQVTCAAEGCAAPVALPAGLAA